MNYDEAKNLKSFKNCCNCGGSAWTMNGRNPARPHMSWCPQIEEYNEWYDLVGAELIAKDRKETKSKLGYSRNNMNEKLNELRLDAGIARIENQQWLCVLDKETGMMIDPMIGLEKFAELIVRECATAFEAEVDTWKEMDPYQGSIKRQGTKAIKKHFGV